jgi:Protein of unknown function (DUF4235)
MGKLIHRALGTAFAIPISIVMKKALDAAWQKGQRGDMPHSPKAPEAQLPTVLIYAAMSGLSLGVGQFIASRAAAAAYELLTGRYPPGWAPSQRSGAGH